MKLHYLPDACSLAAHIVLEWTGTRYQSVRINRQAMKPSPCLARDPADIVPMLETGDFSLTDTIAILGYLADLHPGARLLGDGSPHGRAEVMHWLGFLGSGIHASLKSILGPSLFSDADILMPMAIPARKQIRSSLERLDAQLAGRDWLTGVRSIADAYLFVTLRWAVNLHVDMHGLDHLLPFIDRMQADEGVRTALFVEEGLLCRHASGYRIPEPTPMPDMPDQRPLPVSTLNRRHA